jgi:hypothetical protein
VGCDVFFLARTFGRPRSRETSQGFSVEQFKSNSDLLGWRVQAMDGVASILCSVIYE